MPLDPSIILQSRGPQLPDAAGLLQLRNLGLQGKTQQSQLDAAKKKSQDATTLADLYKKNTGADGKVDAAAMTRDLAASGLGAQIPDFQKSSAENAGAATGNQAAELKLKKQKLDLVNNQLGGLLADPELSHDKVIATISGLVDQGIIDQQQGLQMVQSLPGPDKLRPFLVQKALETLDASKQLEATTPSFKTIDTGGEVHVGATNPQTGEFTEKSSLKKTATPGEQLTNKRLSSGGGSSLTPAAVDLAAQRLLNGEPANKVLANFGRGAQGARDIAAVQNRFAELASGAGADATEIATRVQELSSEARTRLELGAREGKIAPRVQEALNFAKIAKDASAQVPRGNFVPWSKLSQFSDTQLSDPNLAKLKAATNSLINAYAAAVGGGTPTVHDKEEAEKVLNNAQSPEAYAAVVDQLITETKAALEAPKDVMKDLRKTTRERADERQSTPAATKSGASVSNW